MPRLSQLTLFKDVSVSNTNSQPQSLSCSISVTNRGGSVDSVACVMPTNWIMIVMCTVFFVGTIVYTIVLKIQLCIVHLECIKLFKTMSEQHLYTNSKLHFNPMLQLNLEASSCFSCTPHAKIIADL